MTTPVQRAPVNLDTFLLFMRYKLDLRRRRPPNPSKWPIDAVDENGDRDWTKCSPAFLAKKLEEEKHELFAEMYRIEGRDLDALAFEAADVALVAFMIADAAGVDWQGIINDFQNRSPR